MSGVVVSCRNAAGCWYVAYYPSAGRRSRYSQLYPTAEEADALRVWLDERAAGYPRLARFEGGANWPAGGYDADELWRPPGHMPPPGLIEPNDVSNI